VHLRLSCWGSAHGDCAGDAWLEQRKRVLGSGRFRIAVGESRVRIRLSKRAQRLVRHATLRATAFLETSGPFGEAQKDRKVVTLRPRT
jgi:hypothetical protein